MDRLQNARCSFKIIMEVRVLGKMFAFKDFFQRKRAVQIGTVDVDAQVDGNAYGKRFSMFSMMRR